MESAWAFLLSGAVFGLAGGVSPGPTSTLVITQTLRHGLREGLKVAVSPLVADIPIVLVAVLALNQLQRAEWAIGLIALGGALFCTYLAYETFRADPSDVALDDATPRSLTKGVVTNLLNPHPHLFWFMIGAPAIVTAASIGTVAVLGYLLGLYGCLIGAKVTLAILVERSRAFLSSRGYRIILRLLGIALAGFAVRFAIDAARHLGSHG